MSKLKVLSPYDEHIIEEIDLVDEKHVEKVLAKSHDLFTNQKKWIPKYERAAILERTVQIMEGKKEELTKIATEEGGKPYTDSAVEVDRAINGVKLAIEHLGQLAGTEIPMGQTQSSANRLAFTMREPIGIVGSISAFNHPLNLIIHQTVPGIAVGCPVIIKPALTTPRSCFAFMDILYEAGLPKEWCEAFVSENEAAEKLVVDERINYFSFIGSAKVGWYLRSKLSPGTRCALEHGGAAPVIVEKDANVDEILPALMKGAFYHAGQVCVSVQRIFAEESIAADLAGKMADAAEKLVVGDPLDKKTEVGPLILPREVDRVDEWVKEADSKGGKILCGDKKLDNNCYAPTVIYNPGKDAKVSTLEIFGPVVCVYPYKKREEAIQLANSLAYAFQASVFTKNLDVALDTMKQLNATAVMVNDHSAFRVDWMPFGGRDASGIGMGGIPYSMHEMTRDKLMVIKSEAL